MMKKILEISLMRIEDGILNDSFVDADWNDPEGSKISSTSSPT